MTAPEGATLVIATVMEPAPEKIDAAITRARLDGADAVEVRLDAAPGVEPERIGASFATRAEIPLLVSCRSVRDGGSFTGPEEARVAILERAARTGRFRLDVEWGSAAERLNREHPEWVAIVSHHDLEQTPDDLEERARGLVAATHPGQIAKLITTARTASDNLRIRDLLRGGAADRPAEKEGRVGHGPRDRERLAAFAMGEAGRPSRILASCWGSAAVWAAADASLPGAAGQIDVMTLLERYRFRALGPRTRVFAVAGASVSGSLSPALHNAAFQRLGLDAVYISLECSSAVELDLLIDEIPLDGVSITAPLKVAALRLLDGADAWVKRTGACNTIVVRPYASGPSHPGQAHEESIEPPPGISAARDPHPILGLARSAEFGGLRLPRRGFNTDADALLEEVRAHLDPAGRETIVVGAGGAARAAAFALASAGATVTVAARRPDRGQELAREVGGLFRPISDLRPGPGALVIQATSAPMDDPVVPEGARRAALILDMRYGRSPGALQRSAEHLGTPFVDGLGMLARQARAQVRLFTGRDVPLEVLREASGMRRSGLST